MEGPQYNPLSYHAPPSYHSYHERASVQPPFEGSGITPLVTIPLSYHEEASVQPLFEDSYPNFFFPTRLQVLFN